MAFVPSNWRRFLIILVELFVILKIYDVAKDKIGLSLNLYLIILFIFFWIFNFFLSKIEFGRGVDDTLVYKLLPRMIFSSDWFGIGIAAAILAGFFFSKLLGSAFLVVLVVLFLGIFAYMIIRNRKNILRHSWGLVLLGFIFGVGIGNRFLTDGLFVIAFFLICGFILYMSSSPGEV